MLRAAQQKPKEHPEVFDLVDLLPTMSGPLCLIFPLTTGLSDLFVLTNSFSTLYGGAGQVN
jgi:hypothetical protein